jgi:hypothetical protein
VGLVMCAAGLASIQSWSTAKLSIFRTRASTRFARTGAPRSTTRSTRARTSRRVMGPRGLRRQETR